MINQLLIINLLVLTLNSVFCINQICEVKLIIQDFRNSSKDILVLINGKHVLNLIDVKTNNEESIVEIVVPISPVFQSAGNHSIAVYTDDSGLSLIGLKDVYISPEDYNNCIHKTTQQKYRQKRFSPNGRSIGLQYSVWHGFPANAVFKMQKLGATIKTIETLIVEGKSIDDYWSHGVTESDYFQVEPKRGFYCFYRKRTNESTGFIPDCPNIELILSEHAQLLSQSGVDYVYVDLTNLCEKSPSEDVMQRRPMEILFEEWHKLRTQGKQTPQIVAWNRIDMPVCKTWRDYLDLYEKYPDLVWKDSKTGKKIFMGTKDSVPDIKQKIESNNGKNDVIVINNWVATTDEAHAGKLWQFMGFCGNEIGEPSTDIIGRKTCNQAVTRNSPIGDQISTGISYQMDYASVPWGSATSFYGLTFLMQWDTALKANPQHITISGWNEFTAGAWTNGAAKNFTKSMGMNGTADKRCFVDLYGAYRSRDIEPTVEYGNKHLSLMQSCIRVRNLNLHNNRNDCSVANEICCQLNQMKQFVQIYSFKRNDSNDYMLSNNSDDRQAVLKLNYKEICVFNGNSMATRHFCMSANPNDLDQRTSGPFIIYDRDGPNRRPIYRCRTITNSIHFISLKIDCESEKLEYLLGYVSTKKDSLFSRPLIRCVTNSKVHYHAIDISCHPNDHQDQGDILGYVI